MISYATAYLKNYFPVEFYAALMSFEADKTPKDSKLQDYICDCYQKDIDILPPDINESGKKFIAINSQIRFGLESVKGIGGKALDDILDKRPFDGIEDIYNRVNRRVVNKTVIEALIKSGALDSFDKNRKKLLQDYKELRNMGYLAQKLFKINEEMEEDDYIRMELDTLGMSITYPSEWDKAKGGDILKLEGEIININLTEDKNGNEMAFVDLKTERDIIDMVVFTDQMRKCKFLFEEGNEIIVRGEKTDSNSLKLKGVRQL